MINGWLLNVVTEWLSRLPASTVAGKSGGDHFTGRAASH
jgi:hypothetical protein